MIDGKVFINPTFKDFAPAIEEMLSNPAVKAQSQEKDSTGLFKNEEDKAQYIRNKEITLEEIEGQLMRAWPSTGAQDKLQKLNTIDAVFQTRSWEAVRVKGLDELRAGLIEITSMVEEALRNQFPDVEKPKSEKKETV